MTKNQNSDNASTVPDDMTYRSAAVQSATLNESERSIECVMCTESPVRMFDWWNDEFFDEVLLAEGARMGDSLVLLNNHRRYDSSDVVGSVRGMRRQDTSWLGRMSFVADDPDVEKIYQRYKQGHMKDVSIGYGYTREGFKRINKGESAVINGRTFTASKDRPMRVVFEWEARELSVTPIGADRLAKTRSVADCKFGQRIQSIDSDARSQSVSSDVTQERERMTTTTEATTAADEKTTEATRSEQAAEPKKDAVIDNAREQEIIKAERERVEYAQGFASQGVRADLVQQAIKEGWDKNKMNERFLESITSGRSQPANGGAPAIHSHNSERSDADIQAVFLARAGIDIESGRFSSEHHQYKFGRSNTMNWAVRAAQVMERGGNLDEKAERALEFSYRYRSHDLVELCRMALELKHIEFDRFANKDEIVTRFLTTQSVVPFMSNALGAMILDAFVGSSDTTGWCQSVYLPNDNPQPVVKGGMGSRLKKRLSGQVPESMTREATEELISVATFSEQYFVDRKDMLADRFGRIGEGPQELGSAAMDLIQDLVYSVVLSNPTLAADNKALFHTDHKNLKVSSPLSADNLAALKVAMATQTNNGRLLSCVPGTLLVAESKAHIADEIIGSSEKRDTTANTKYGTKNWAKDKFSIVSEPRLDVGCVDPNKETHVAGRPNDYMLIERNGRYGYMKSFLRSNNGAPVIEHWTPGDGRIGIGTTVELEAGMKAVSFEGLQCGTSESTKT